MEVAGAARRLEGGRWFDRENRIYLGQTHFSRWVRLMGLKNGARFGGVIREVEETKTYLTAHPDRPEEASSVERKSRSRIREKGAMIGPHLCCKGTAPRRRGEGVLEDRCPHTLDGTWRGGADNETGRCRVLIALEQDHPAALASLRGGD